MAYIGIRFRWQKEQQRGWTLLDPREPGNAVSNIDTLYVNLKDFQGFGSNSQSWLRVHFRTDHLEFLRYGAGIPYQMKYPESLQLLAALVQGRRLLIIGKTNLWEVDLEQVASLATEVTESTGKRK